MPAANTVGAADWSNSPAYGSPYFAEGFSSGGPGELLFDRNGDRLPETVSDGKVDFLAPDGTDTSTPGFEAFLGTSAAAPNAAAVAALMLQADPNLSPSQVTDLLKAFAIDYGLSSSKQGAGLIQAPAAVAGALRLAASSAALQPPDRTVDLPFHGIASGHHQGGTAFVYSPGDAAGAIDVIRGFQVEGAGHDTVSLPGSDFGNSIADVLNNTTQTLGGSSIVTDPTTGGTVKLAGITKRQLAANRGDFAFHA